MLLERERERAIMEKHNFNLCFKSFANGSHMRSHFLNLYVNPKPPHPPSPSPSPEDEDSDGYDLRKKSFRSARSEISFAGEVTVTVTANVTTTETEPWRNATVRRRSKRNRKPEKSMITVSDFSPVSSISDISPEEDVARCLMMLSRDRWKPNKSDESGSESELEKEIVNVSRTPPARSRYRCGTCNRGFRSYQALGGHRASHKKIRPGRHNIRQQESRNVGMGDNKLHECPVCFKVFASGQALGGHKRSHVTASSSAITKQRVNLIDLNLPAPIEDDEVSQMEVSVVSD